VVVVNVVVADCDHSGHGHGHGHVYGHVYGHDHGHDLVWPTDGW